MPCGEFQEIFNREVLSRVLRDYNVIEFKYTGKLFIVKIFSVSLTITKKLHCNAHIMHLNTNRPQKIDPF